MKSTVEIPKREMNADVYCPICTHTVTGVVVKTGKAVSVKAGQKCSHCHGSLDAGYVFGGLRAA